MFDAIKHGDIDALQRLIDAKADIEQRGEGSFTPLMRAVRTTGRGKQYEATELLLAANANVKAYFVVNGSLYWTATNIAIYHDLSRKLELLLIFGATVVGNEWGPIRQKMSLSCAKVLIHFGVHITDKDIDFFVIPHDTRDEVSRYHNFLTAQDRFKHNAANTICFDDYQTQANKLVAEYPWVAYAVGTNLRKMPDYKRTAFEWFQTGHAKGHLYCQMALAECYSTAHGTTRNWPAAVSLLNDCLQKIRLYKHHDRDPRIPKQAALLAALAAFDEPELKETLNAEDIQAQNMARMSLVHAYLLLGDSANARKYAHRLHTDFSLGLTALEGWDGTSDLKRAIKHFVLAKTAMPTLELEEFLFARIGTCAATKEDHAKQMLQALEALAFSTHAETKADAEVKADAIPTPNTQALAKLQSIYLSGHGPIAKNAEQQLIWAQHGALANNPRAVNMLGSCLQYDAKNTALALDWYEQGGRENISNIEKIIAESKDENVKARARIALIRLHIAADQKDQIKSHYAALLTAPLPWRQLATGLALQHGWVEKNTDVNTRRALQAFKNAIAAGLVMQANIALAETYLQLPEPEYEAAMQAYQLAYRAAVTENSSFHRHACIKGLEFIAKKVTSHTLSTAVAEILIACYEQEAELEPHPRAKLNKLLKLQKSYHSAGDRYKTKCRDVAYQCAQLRIEFDPTIIVMELTPFAAAKHAEAQCQLADIKKAKDAFTSVADFAKALEYALLTTPPQHEVIQKALTALLDIHTLCDGNITADKKLAPEILEIIKAVCHTLPGKLVEIKSEQPDVFFKNYAAIAACVIKTPLGSDKTFVNTLLSSFLAAGANRCREFLLVAVDYYEQSKDVEAAFSCCQRLLDEIDTQLAVMPISADQFSSLIASEDREIQRLKILATSPHPASKALLQRRQEIIATRTEKEKQIQREEQLKQYREDFHQADTRKAVVAKAKQKDPLALQVVTEVCDQPSMNASQIDAHLCLGTIATPLFDDFGADDQAITFYATEKCIRLLTAIYHYNQVRILTPIYRPKATIPVEDLLPQLYLELAETYKQLAKHQGRLILTCDDGLALSSGRTSKAIVETLTKLKREAEAKYAAAPKSAPADCADTAVGDNYPDIRGPAVEVKQRPEEQCLERLQAAEQRHDESAITAAAHQLSLADNKATLTHECRRLRYLSAEPVAHASKAKQVLARIYAHTRGNGKADEQRQQALSLCMELGSDYDQATMQCLADHYQLEEKKLWASHSARTLLCLFYVRNTDALKALDTKKRAAFRPDKSEVALAQFLLEQLDATSRMPQAAWNPFTVLTTALTDKAVTNDTRFQTLATHLGRFMGKEYAAIKARRDAPPAAPPAFAPHHAAAATTAEKFVAPLPFPPASAPPADAEGAPGDSKKTPATAAAAPTVAMATPAAPLPVAIASLAAAERKAFPAAVSAVMATATASQAQLFSLVNGRRHSYSFTKRGDLSISPFFTHSGQGAAKRIDPPIASAALPVFAAKPASDA